MLRAAEAQGLAGFSFTEHVFHLDEPRVASRYLGTRWDGELVEPPAAAAVALEVNGSGGRVYPELVQLLCESIARAGTPVSLGSDAHRPHSVGAVLRGVDLLRGAGVRRAVAFERRHRRDIPL